MHDGVDSSQGLVELHRGALQIGERAREALGFDGILEQLAGVAVAFVQVLEDIVQRAH